MVNNLRGNPIKYENSQEIRIEREFLTRKYLLRLNKNLCNGCGLCSKICPEEAIKEEPPLVVNGHLEKKPTIDFDIDSCILCGECAVLCPLNALDMEVDGKEISTFVKNEAFPVLLKEINITKEKCDPECDAKCQEECPTEAIRVTKKSEKGQDRITNVQITESLCFYCKRCELACDHDAIQVRKPFRGSIELNTDLCPEGCMACAEICPTHTIQIENDKPQVFSEFCIFCSACQKVCPNQAIDVSRDWIFHTDVTAAAWLTALKKLTSVKTVAKELRIKSGQRRTSTVRGRERQLHLKSEQPNSDQAEAFLKILNKYKK
ncbi:MAG: 4Fe-4S binding protein [Candidatus Bathyarchaeum sp.]|nr:MAG: 4Fe-4S binding protein [Candidatus Bathyarchaeum sp.]